MAKKLAAAGTIESHCTKCKLNLDHTIIAMEDEKVARVKCNTCGSEHNYKAAVKKKAASKADGTPAVKRAPSTKGPERRWEAALQNASGNDISYEMTRAYSVGDVIMHKTFGKGIVLNTASKKVTMIFKDQERLLVSTNR